MMQKEKDEEKRQIEISVENKEQTAVPNSIKCRTPQRAFCPASSAAC
jgi:hypothetical protein